MKAVLRGVRWPPDPARGGRPPARETRQRLAALVTRLTDLRVAQRNQRRLVTVPAVLVSCDDLLAVLAGQIRRVESQIADLIGADPPWAALDAAFRSVKGVADRTVARLMAGLPQIGTLSGKAVRKLAGLAPIAHDGGTAQACAGGMVGRHLRRGGSSPSSG